MFSKGTRVLYFLRKKEYQIITTEEIFHLIAELPFILFMDLVVHDAGLPWKHLNEHAESIMVKKRKNT